MAARGSNAKIEITNKIMEVFPGAFIYGGKELRIPINENGEVVEIKVALTCAKTNVGDSENINTSNVSINEAAPSISSTTPTEEEKANIAILLNRLGI